MKSSTHTVIEVAKIAVAIVLSLALVGCTTMQRIQYEDVDQISYEVAVGDEVEILHESGRWIRFKVSHIDEQHIAGEGNQILLASVKELRVEKVSAGKTAAGTVTVLVAAVALFFYLGLKKLDERLGD